MSFSARDDFWNWVENGLKKQESQHIASDESKEDTERLHYGAIYVEDILEVLRFLDAKSHKYQFRILDRLCTEHEGEKMQRLSISKSTFSSEKDFVQDLNEKPPSNYVFSHFFLIGEGFTPVNVMWSSNEGNFLISQKFGPGFRSGQYTDNIVYALADRLKSKRESIWYRYEPSIYYAIASNILSAAALFLRNYYIVQGYISFSKDGMGEFQFGYVHGFMDCRYSEREGNEAVEFSWEGNDEMDQASGRGFAIIKDKNLSGHLFFHEGDDSEFKATQQKQA